MILLVLPILLYAGTLRFGYVLDDTLVLSENKFVQQGTKGIAGIFGNEALVGFLGENHDIVVGARYRPLSLVTFAIEHQVFGASPGISHFINALLYALTALLIFRLLSLVLPAKAAGPWYLGLPFVAALLFALHPIHTEVVANIKGRDEIMALLLALAAAYYVLRAIYDQKPWLTIVAGALFLLAILSKENAITFIIVVPLLVFAFTKTSLRQMVMAMIPLTIATVVYVFIRLSAVGYLLDGGQEITDLMNNPFVDAKGSQQSATISMTLVWYLKLLIFPHPLTHDYYPYHVPLVTWGDWRAIMGLVTHLGLVGLGIWTWRKDRLVSVAIWYYLATLSVVSNIFFPLSLFMNERFLYMPSVAFCLVLAWFLSQKLPRWMAAQPKVARVLALSLLGVLGLGYALRTVTRVPAWENTYTLNAASIEVSSESAYSNQYYGYSLYKMADKEENPIEKKKLLDAALPYIDRALEIFPKYPEALGTKTGIMVTYFQMDNQIAPLLKWFEYVQKNRPISYIDTVLKDLVAFGQHRVELNYFLQEVGYNHFWVVQGNAKMANQYLQMLKTIDPTNPNVDRAISNVQQGIR